MRVLAEAMRMLVDVVGVAVEALTQRQESACTVETTRMSYSGSESVVEVIKVTVQMP